MARVPGKVVKSLYPLRLFPGFAIQVQVKRVESTLEFKIIFVLMLSQIVFSKGVFNNFGIGATVTVKSTTGPGHELL